MPDAVVSRSGLELALGIIATPADRSTRDNIRKTWLRDQAFVDGVATARFVLGSAPCAQAHASEQLAHGDIAFVNASDCSPWHAGHKVHAWYQYALHQFNARFYAKAEDDSLVSIRPLLHDLAMVRRVSPEIHMYGINLQWLAHCRQTQSSAWTKAQAARTCAQGCWLGRLGQHRQRPPRCERAFDGAPVAAGSDMCPVLPCTRHAHSPPCRRYLYTRRDCEGRDRFSQCRRALRPGPP